MTVVQLVAGLVDAMADWMAVQTAAAMAEQWDYV